MQPAASSPLPLARPPATLNRAELDAAIGAARAAGVGAELLKRAEERLARTDREREEEATRLSCERRLRSLIALPAIAVDREALQQAIFEADRHLLIGALEPVPDHLVEEVARDGVVHPWVVVKQGSKWRLCHDYALAVRRAASD